MESPFDVLRVDRDADEAEVDRAYRELVLETHPDQGGSREEFQLVRAAYEAIESGEWEAGGTAAAANGDREAASAGDWQSPYRRNRHDGSWVTYLDYDVLDDFG